MLTGPEKNHHNKTYNKVSVVSAMGLVRLRKLEFNDRGLDGRGWLARAYPSWTVKNLGVYSENPAESSDAGSADRV
jgi:hypothetical protein